jgi:hypothetical protein
MDMAIKHAKTAPADDGSGEVNAAEWNADHVIADNTIQPAHIQAVGGESKVTFDVVAGHKHDGVLARQQSHGDLSGVTADQHHAKLHAGDHVIGGADALSVGVPVNIGTANSEGSATNFARRDHVHAHPSGLGTDLHHAKLHNTSHKRSGGDPIIRHGVIVDPAGYGDYTTIQDAINSLS